MDEVLQKSRLITIKGISLPEANSSGGAKRNKYDTAAENKGI